MKMKKVIISVLMVCLMVTTAFASGSTEDTRAWFDANNIADESSNYVATNREATLTLQNGKALEAAAAYRVINGALLTRTIDGQDNVFALLDTLSDGYVLTPFEDDIILLDKNYIGLENVDGIQCLVFDCDIAVYDSIFFYGKEQGGDLLGADENETDGSVNIKVYIDSQTHSIVKEEITYLDLPFLTDLELKQEVIFTNSNNINVPERITTTGSFRVRGSKNFAIYDVYSFKVEETQSNFEYMKQYDHE